MLRPAEQLVDSPIVVDWETEYTAPMTPIPRRFFHNHDTDLDTTLFNDSIRARFCKV